MMTRPTPRIGTIQFILDNSLLLIGGTVVALVWANLNYAAYEHFAHSIHFAVNDVGMVFFFALATKEVVEAMLPGGPLSSPKQAAVPVLAAVGGMMGPAFLFLAAAYALDPQVVRGWAIPCATDIAFSYLVARVVFRKGHPAIPFLLLLAIADDALGLIILAIFYPSGTLDMSQLGLWMGAAVATAWLLRTQRIHSFWMYLLGPGVMSWIGLYQGGLHPALALVPIVPFMPHAKTDLGLFDTRERHRRDTLSQFEHWWKLPVQGVLLLFGLVNAGVPLGAMGQITWMVAGSLIIGKPIGIMALTLLAGSMGFPRARELDLKTMLVLGVMAGIGFTVALFFTTAAFPITSPYLDQAKMGALLSFLAAPIAILLARTLRVR
jgi:NhaA family Na+:H+ antiporter